MSCMTLLSMYDHSSVTMIAVFFLAHGACRENLMPVHVLKKQPGACVLTFDDGQTYVADYWQKETISIRVGCECTVKTTSWLSSYVWHLCKCIRAWWLSLSFWNEKKELQCFSNCWAAMHGVLCDWTRFRSCWADMGYHVYAKCDTKLHTQLCYQIVPFNKTFAHPWLIWTITAMWVILCNGFVDHGLLWEGLSSGTALSRSHLPKVWHLWILCCDVNTSDYEFLDKGFSICCASMIVVLKPKELMTLFHVDSDVACTFSLIS